MNSMSDKYNQQMNVHSEQKKDLKNWEEKFNNLNQTHSETSEKHEKEREKSEKFSKENERLLLVEKESKQELLNLKNRFEQNSFEHHFQIENLKSQKSVMEEKLDYANQFISNLQNSVKNYFFFLFFILFIYSFF